MRNLGGAIGIAACGTILNDRGNLHFQRLAEHMNSGNAAMLEMLARGRAAYTNAFAGNVAQADSAALHQLWSLTWREAQTQTYSDAFFLIMLAFVAAAAFVPLMRKAAAPAAPSADAH
jgi:DHA2 family multidrug resistance protein